MSSPALLLQFIRGSFPRATLALPAGRSSAVGDRRFALLARGTSPLREFLEVLGLIAAVTVAGTFMPLSYHALGHVYLLTVIVLCLRVGRWPALAAAIISGLAWNFVFIPPQLSFSVLNFDDGLLLGTYCVVALIAGQLTARIRAQERSERQREQRATALFHLTRVLTGARTLDEAVRAALRQADELFGAQTALLLPGGTGGLAPHPASSLAVAGEERAVAERVWRDQHEAGRFTEVSSKAAALHLPLQRGGTVLGVLVLRLPEGSHFSTPQQHELFETFASQIALLVEREQLRTASEREKLLTESDRLHRTLLDSVSHELRTPLSIIRSAAETLPGAGATRLSDLAGEILIATNRLDRVVANLLSQTRLESGAVKPQLEWCDARDLIGAARRGLGEALAGRSLKVEIPEDMPLFMADAPLMEQVITNLLHNAAHHTPAGTPVLVTAGVDKTRARISITVADHGPGLAPGQSEHLFQKFQRGPATKSTGLGLGLSIARGLMLAQGGDVEAGANPGSGARFTVYLPYTPHDSVPNE